MTRVIFEVLIGSVFFIWAKWFADDNLKPELFGMAIGVCAALVIEFILFAIEKRKFYRLYWDCYKPFAKKEVRLSIAYLFRIENNGKYLLIRSQRRPNEYQPVGGVYKYFHPEAKKYLDKLGAITDNYIPNDDDSEYDLRLKLQNRKKLPQLLHWFLNTNEREISPWREFFEELVEPNILNKSVFGYIYYELIGQHFQNIYFNQHAQISAFLYSDIFIPRFINHQQLNEIRRLSTTESIEYIWATEAEIKRGETSTGKKIAAHSYKIFITEKFK